MIVLRGLGWLFLLLAAAVFAFEIFDYAQRGDWSLTRTGELWFRIDSSGLNTAQAAIQRYLHPRVWDWGVRPVLLLPALVFTLVPGVVLLWLGRPRGETQGRRRRRRRR